MDTLENTSLGISYFLDLQLRNDLWGKEKYKTKQKKYRQCNF
jgi:hypothetical protein